MIGVAIQVYYWASYSYGGIKGNWVVLGNWVWELGNWFELHTCFGGELGFGNWGTGVVVLATSWAPIVVFFDTCFTTFIHQKMYSYSWA